MKYLITGSNGQLGKEVDKYLTSLNYTFVGYDRVDLDITDYQQVLSVFDREKPDVIFHCAAYTAVDKAEDEGRDANYLVNVTGTENISKACEHIGATLVYISTDYVFDGNKHNEMYSEEDKTNPINQYGEAKLQGEEKVIENCSKYYIIRTSWVFGEFGNNFVYTMKRLANERDELTIVDDQIGRPTWTRTLAEFMVYLVDKTVEFGIYNLSNEGSCSWYEFAREILKNDDVKIIPVTSSEFIQKATRPKYSVLDLKKSDTTGFKNTQWQEALAKMLGENE